MSYAMLESLILLGVLAWPLVVAGLLIIPGLRLAGLALAPWAALPALALSAFPDGALNLPGVMLGGVLALDATGRLFLFLISLLWLASGVLARARLRAAASDSFAVLLLLAMAGSFGLVLAGDGLLFFTAATIAGYSLYGALGCEADTQAHKAGKVLVVLLVFSDVLVFEVLLMLGQAAGAVDFESLRQAFVEIESKNLVFGLLIVGFGIKVGMLGVHFWLPPVFATANAALRPALVAFMFGAGVLGALRLLPLGQIQATEVATVLNWLAWVTLGYAAFVGMLQNQRRAILGYATIALGSVWLFVLSAWLQQPGLWQTLAGPSAAALIQSGAGLAAILLMDKPNNEGASSHSLAGLVPALRWLAVLILAMSPLGLVWAMAGHVPSITLLLAIVVIALLAANSLFHGDIDPSASRPTQVQQHIALWVIATLILVVTLVAAYQLLHVTMGQAATSLVILVVAIMAAVLNAKWHLLRLPVLPPGDVLVPITRGLVKTHAGAARLYALGEEGWTGIAQAINRQLQPFMALGGVVGLLEPKLIRWGAALSLLLLLGLLVAWLAVS